MAYLAETVTSRCEVIEELRSKESKLAGDWENYSSNGNYRGYNRSFFISEQCTLLDLRNPKMLFREKDKKGKPITTGTPFSKMIMELFSQEFCNYYFELIALSDERVYPLTQGIANKAYQHSFNGIAYTSARQPKNRPIYLSNCFVIFEKKFIIPFENLPEDQRQRRCELKAPWDICNSSFWDDLRNEPLS